MNDCVSRATTIKIDTGPTEEQLEKQQTLEEYKEKEKVKELSESDQLREDLIELEMRALNNGEDFVELVVEYILKKPQ